MNNYYDLNDNKQKPDFGPAKDMLFETLDHMIARPMMYAQNLGSLEDQVALLLSLIDSFDNVHPRSNHESYHTRYRKFCREYVEEPPYKSNFMPSQHFLTIENLSQFLRVFFETVVKPENARREEEQSSAGEADLTVR